MISPSVGKKNRGSNFLKTNRHLIFSISPSSFRFLAFLVITSDSIGLNKVKKVSFSRIKKCYTPLISNILSIFARERGGLHTAAMKRETGENPVQSRCCMFHRRKHLHAIDCG